MVKLRIKNFGPIKEIYKDEYLIINKVSVFIGEQGSGTPPPYLRRMRLLPGQGRRCWMANAAADCPWQSSCKSPRTLQKCKLLITRQLALEAVLGEHKLSSPSTRLKVNHLCIRYLCFESVRGDFLEGHSYASRCHFYLFPSTKTTILCSGG